VKVDDELVAISGNTFSEIIEEMVWEKDISYMDAVLKWCEDRGFEPEIGAELVKKSKPLAAKIQNEAEDLRFLPRSARLPGV
jgi:hypothetical protein